MSASPELTHYLSQPPSVHRMHLLETLALNKLHRWGVGWLVVTERAGRGGFVVLNVAVKSGSTAEYRLKRFILILRGFFEGEKLEKMQCDRPGYPQREANPRRQLHSPCSDDDNDANASEIERIEGSGFTFCMLKDGREGRNQGPGPRQLLFSLCLAL